MQYDAIFSTVTAITVQKANKVFMFTFLTKQTNKMFNINNDSIETDLSLERLTILYNFSEILIGS